jgi:DNA-binding transcriptional ArsR family regulator
MEIKNATVALAALGQTTRLSVFRLLVEAGPGGRMVGEIAEALELPGATLSFHLKELTAAGLIEGESRGRYICYRANFDAMNDLIEFLTRNCCGGDASRCAPAKKVPASKAAPVRKVPVKKAIRT